MSWADMLDVVIIKPQDAHARFSKQESLKAAEAQSSSTLFLTLTEQNCTLSTI